MIRFKYALNQDIIELQASNWNGVERVFVNGNMVSHKLNFKHQSEHSIELKEGGACKFELLIDPITDELMCRIYRQNTLVASLKQGKKDLLSSRRYLHHAVIITSLILVLALYVN